MIVCPFCKEEIVDGSRYCDQCGNPLSYCHQCGHVGMGKRCTRCGGLMVSAAEYESVSQHTVMSNGASSHSMRQTAGNAAASSHVTPDDVMMPDDVIMPQLMLVNNSLNICIQGINGAILGRRQGPYRQMFERNLYVSGIHAQLFYTQNNGWCVMDKNSSNGTMLNNRRLRPDSGVRLNNGDVLVLANVSLQVIIKVNH